MENKLRQIFGDKLKKISDVADVVCGPFGSAIKNTDYRESGIPLIRITNISKDGYMNYDDLIFISEELGNSLSRTQVSSGDIVVSQRGSLGQCAIVDDAFPKMNISANIIAIKNICGISATFLHDYFLSTVGQTLLERSVSGQVQQKITTQDIADLLIPIDTNEESLTTLISKAYELYKCKLRQADELLAGMSSFIHSVLKMNEISSERPMLFAVKKNSVAGIRIDPEYHNPFYARRIAEIRKQPFDMLENIVEFSTESWNQKDHFNEAFPYIEISNVYLRENKYDISHINISDAPSRAKMIVRNGDIIVSTTRPHRGAIATIKCPDDEMQIASTGFCVLRKLKRKDVLKEYLQWMLLDDYVLLQMLQRSSGGNYPAIVSDELKKIVIPIPDLDKQKTICDEAKRRQKQAKTLRLEAEQEWAAAKAQFEKELLGE